MTDELRNKSNEVAHQLLHDAQVATPGSPEQKACIDGFKTIISAQNEADTTDLAIYKDEASIRNDWRKTIIDGAIKAGSVIVKAGLVVVTLIANIKGWWYPKDPYNEANRLN